VDNVLGLARTGLIFTGLQEGAQPGGGGWPHLAKQSPIFHTMWHHAGFRCGGAVRRERSRGLGGRGASAVRESGCLGRTVRCCVFSLSVSLLFLFPSVCCSVKLPLSRSTSFCLFLFILLRTPAEENRSWFLEEDSDKTREDARGNILSCQALNCW